MIYSYIMLYIYRVTYFHRFICTELSTTASVRLKMVDQKMLGSNGVRQLWILSIWEFIGILLGTHWESLGNPLAVWEGLGSLCFYQWGQGVAFATRACVNARMGQQLGMSPAWCRTMTICVKWVQHDSDIFRPSDLVLSTARCRCMVQDQYRQIGES